MADLDNLGTSTSAKLIARAVLWALFNATKDDSVRVKVLGIPVSFKIAQLQPLIERWVGPQANA